MPTGFRPEQGKGNREVQAASKLGGNQNMASGYYPLETRFDPCGKKLAKIVDDLRVLYESRYSSDYGLPSACSNDQPDNAASDGQYEAYIGLSLELLERCIKRHSQESK